MTFVTRLYEAAIYACYYRLAPIIADSEEKRRIWTDVKREYAQIFLMGRRIWRRASHPSRLRVVYDMAMLCVRFGDMEDDSTSEMFRESLHDADNFDYRLLDEVQFAKSVDKINLLENHIIDQFYVRRRSSGSFRSSFRSKKPVERTPSKRSTNADEADLAPGTAESQQIPEVPSELCAEKEALHSLTLSVDNLFLKSVPSEEPADAPKKCSTIPWIRVDAPMSKTEPVSSHRLVHFSDEEPSDDEV
ncbi:unnamed protein product [Heligmosomoides polygyrus]|uniref:Bestrophin homolog n=1 Tax=Heligmosomoides polygyrus TaxID=6339 RepID=A0A183GCG3_HELPZ|nr:unnamed protein product [Heligmosomoides polygyrus]